LKLAYPKYSVHKIYHENEFPFSPHEYSLFKFGKRSIAEKFARQYFEYINELFRQDCISGEVIIFPSPYKYIPTASGIMAQEVINLLTTSESAKRDITYTKSKINRSQTYSQDYGELSLENRLKLIQNDVYIFDQTPKPDRTLLFIDDISITGAHQAVIEQVLIKSGVENRVYFSYFAELCNQKIKPQIENVLNYYEVNTSQKIINLFFEEDFALTTRYVKRVLTFNAESLDEFLSLVKKTRKYDQLEKFYNASLHNDYHLHSDYAANLNTIELYLKNTFHTD
jgi:hypothetical protein